jgi:hypothetical protein
MFVLVVLITMAMATSARERSVLVENLPHGTEVATVIGFFSTVGGLQDFVPLSDTSGYVVYQDSKSVPRAVGDLHDKVFMQHTISVTEVGEDEGTRVTKMLRQRQQTPSISKSVDLSGFISQLASLSIEDRKAVMAALGDSQHVLKAESPSPGVQRPHPDNPVPAQGAASIVTLPGMPRLSLFSGDEGTKGEVTYTQWHFEVMSLTEEGRYPESLVLQIVRKSLRGRAATLLDTLGAHVTIASILATFSGLFSEVYSSQSLMGEFYTSKQREAESAATWACRLEELIGKLKSCDADMDEPTQLRMKRDRFFNGLTDGCLRSALRHHYDNGVAYDKLLMAARVAELEEMRRSSPKQPQKGKISQVGTDPVLSVLNEIRNDMKQLKDRVSKLETRKTPSYGSTDRGRNATESAFQSQDGTNWRSRGKFQGKCFKCKKFGGHIAKDCPLNVEQPLVGGNQ